MDNVIKGKYLSSTKADFNSKPIHITSLGENRVKYEKERIINENKHFLDRLQYGPSTKSQYRTIKYEEDFHVRSKIVRNVSRYPYILDLKNQSSQFENLAWRDTNSQPANFIRTLES